MESSKKIRAMVLESTLSTVALVTKGTGEITSLVEKACSDGLMDLSIMVIGKMADAMEWEGLLSQMDSYTMVCG